MSEEWTCGKGLAAHAEIPLAMSELMTAMATMLDRHALALDPGEQAGKAEYDAYLSLVAGHRATADAMRSLGNEMAGYATLPMAEHDMAVLTSAELDSAFRSVVAAEEVLLNRLQETVAEHQQMLTGAQ